VSEDLLLRGDVSAPLREADGFAPAIPLKQGDGLDAATRRTLLQEERAIARKYSSTNFNQWRYVAITIAGFAAWVSFFPLAIAGILPLWLGFIASCVLAVGSYVVSHEAMHSNIGRPGSKMRFWNELVGWISTVILIFPFSMARIMHLHHHYYCNDPERDPDFPDEAPTAFKAWIKTWLNRQPGAEGSIHHYKRVLDRIGSPAAKAAQRDTALMQLGAMAFFFTMAWAGHAMEVALLWWLPRHIGLSYIRFYLSWAPHHPRVNTGRYDNTVVFKSRLGHVMSIGMQYHIIHHLYPDVPNHLTKYAYREMRPILIARGVDCSALVD